MLLEIKYVDDKHKDFVKFCNALRCPLCSGQLDGAIHYNQASLYCVNNNEEYNAKWVPGNLELEMETIKYWYTQYEYIISIDRIQSNLYNIVINRANLDVIPIYRKSTYKEIFSYKGARLLFPGRMEEKDFLKKLQIYNIFT